MAAILETKRVLNVGGNTKAIGIPEHYNGWQHDLLDIDPNVNPDIICDARQLQTLPGGTYDAIYNSHNLEHYYSHEVPKVLKGFFHMLKPDGFLEIRVPDIETVMKHAVMNNIDIDDTLYNSPAGPISVKDVIYGYGVEIEQSGCDFFAHKTGFSSNSLKKALASVFPFVIVAVNEPVFELYALAFKARPSIYQQQLLGFMLA
jgi:ubiquinone/menaquinone biosynthesis C-methylase UbiE